MSVYLNIPSSVFLLIVLKNLSTGLNSGVYGHIVNLKQSIFLIHHPAISPLWADALS